MIDINCKVCDNLVVSLPTDEAEFLTATCSECWE